MEQELKMGSLPVRIRRATELDANFIFNSWLKSYRSSPLASQLSSTIYFAEHHKIIERLFKTSEVLVACNETDVSQIYGWICAEKIDGIFCLHYVYMKHTFRNHGIAKALFNSFEHDPTNASCFTHGTRLGIRLANKYNMIYHPYLLMNIEAKTEAKTEPETVSEEQDESEGLDKN